MGSILGAVGVLILIIIVQVLSLYTVFFILKQSFESGVAKDPSSAAGMVFIGIVMIPVVSGIILLSVPFIVLSFFNQGSSKKEPNVNQVVAQVGGTLRKFLNKLAV